MSVPSTMILNVPKQKPRKTTGSINKRKCRKTTRIKGLEAIDFLHNQTLLSTQQFLGEKLPPPPGCVDHQFTALSEMAAGTLPIHTELPPAASDTTYALQILLDLYREQLLNMVKCMKTGTFRERMHFLMTLEKEKNDNLVARYEHLRQQVHDIIEDSLALLKSRMTELEMGDRFESKNLIQKAKQVAHQHQDLKTELRYLQNDVSTLEKENETLLSRCELEGPSPNEILYGYSPISVCQSSIPRVSEPNHPDFRTPAQKKFAGPSADVTNSKTNTPSCTHENNYPPIDKIRQNGHHHHKSSRKSKKSKKHHHHSSQRLDKRHVDNSTCVIQQYNSNVAVYDCQISNSKTVKMKFRTSPPVSSSPNAKTCSKSLRNLIDQNIITRTSEQNTIKSPSTLKKSIDSTDIYVTDYRIVPSLKLALQRHSSKEKKMVSQGRTSVVDDLVNSEIEKSLHTSNANSIIEFTDNFTDHNSFLYKTKSTNKSKYPSKTSEYSSSPDTSADFMNASPVLKLPQIDEISTKIQFQQMKKSSPNNNNNNTNSGALRNTAIPENKKLKPYQNDQYVQQTPAASPSVGNPSTNMVPSTNAAEPSPFDVFEDTARKSNDADNKWQEVSLGFDVMFEFISMKIDNENKIFERKTKSVSPKDSHSKDLEIRSSPPLNSKPPPLHRADSPFEYDDSTTNKSTTTGYPFSPAPLEGPFSPVSSQSPPTFQPIPNSNSLPSSDEKDNQNLNGKYYLNGKFRPKGKDWKWR